VAVPHRCLRDSGTFPAGSATRRLLIASRLVPSLENVVHHQTFPANQYLLSFAIDRSRLNSTMNFHLKYNFKMFSSYFVVCYIEELRKFLPIFLYHVTEGIGYPLAVQSTCSGAPSSTATSSGSRTHAGATDDKRKGIAF
jgi:hypothetical protein